MDTTTAIHELIKRSDQSRKVRESCAKSDNANPKLSARLGRFCVNNLFIYNDEEAAALMESLGNNHGFLDRNKRIAFTATDVFLRRNGFYIEVEGLEGHAFIDGSMHRHEFRFAQILHSIRQHIKSLV
jgi:prophage maintenance system killer protein